MRPFNEEAKGTDCEKVNMFENNYESADLKILMWEISRGKGCERG